MGIWWIRNDPCGLFSAGFTVALILFAQFVIVTVVLLPWYGFTYHVLLYTACSLLSLVSHSRAQFSDPGAVPRYMVPPELPPYTHQFIDAMNPLPPAPRICKICRTIKPAQAFHCSTCERCVVLMDHHCPWINNCVAIVNRKYFMLFLFYTALCCIYSGVLLVGRFVSCSRSPRQCTVAGVGTALCILNFIEALVFGLFVIIMLFDQFSAIFEGPLEAHTHGPTNMSHGGKKAPRPEKYAALKDVFGEPLRLTWLLPLNPTQRLAGDFDRELLECRVKAEAAADAISVLVEARKQALSQMSAREAAGGPNSARASPQPARVTLSEAEASAAHALVTGEGGAGNSHVSNASNTFASSGRRS